MTSRLGQTISKLIFVFLFLMAFLLSNHYLPWGSFYLEFSAFSALLIALIWLCFSKINVSAPTVFLLFFIFSLIPLFQWVFGVIFFQGDAIVACFYLAAFSLSLIVGSSLFFNVSYKSGYIASESVAAVILAAGAVSVWLALIQWLQLGSTIWVHNLSPGGRPYANLGQPNNYSSLIWLSLFSLYYLFERKRVGLFVLLIAGCFLVSGVALAQSRTSWVVLSVLIIAVIIHRGLFRQWRWQRLALPLLAVAGFYVFSLASIELKSFLFQADAGAGMQELRTGTTDIRTDMWLSFIHAIMEKPWLGFGWEQLSAAQVSVAEMHPPIGVTQYSHNLFLDLLIWNGIPLGLLFFALISYLWLRIFFYAYTTKGFYSLCCFTALLVHSLLEYPHAYSYFLLLAGFFIGISGAEPIDSTQFRNIRWLRMPFLATFDGWLTRQYKISKYVLVPVIILFAAALAVSWQDYRVLEEDHRLLRFENASIGTLKADQKAPDVLLFDQLQSFTWVARTKSFDGLTESEQRLIEKVATRYPLPMPLLKLAKLRVVQGRPENATKELRVIEHLHGEQVYKAAEQSLRQFIEGRDGVAGSAE